RRLRDAEKTRAVFILGSFVLGEGFPGADNGERRGHCHRGGRSVEPRRAGPVLASPLDGGRPGGKDASCGRVVLAFQPAAQPNKARRKLIIRRSECRIPRRYNKPQPPTQDVLLTPHQSADGTAIAATAPRCRGPATPSA